MSGVRMKTICAVLLFSVSLTISCSHSSFIENAEKIPGDRCVVIGKFTLIDDGEYLSWNSFYSKFRHLLVILPPEPSEPLLNYLFGDGYTYWDLSPGEYTIAGLVPVLGPNIMEADMFRTKFTVPEGAESLYIGEVIVNKGKRRYTYEIRNNFSSVQEELKKKFPDGDTKPIVDVMQEVKIGTYDAIEPICGDQWGMDCGKMSCVEYSEHYFAGIRPISPPANVVFTASPVIYGLKPEFRWQPSKAADVSYDLVVYESIKMSPFDYNRPYIPGRIVLYKQSLKSPSYQMVQEFKTNERYCWTVRMRKNGTVTNWSSISLPNLYFEHTPALMSGFNLMFSFVTSNLKSD